jgi:glycerol-3-phosphate dehydrogenase
MPSADVVWRYAGVRPLLDDESGNPSAVTRDDRLELDRAAAPLLNVWGGKLTTFRALARAYGGRIERVIGDATSLDDWVPKWPRACARPN